MEMTIENNGMLKILEHVYEILKDGKQISFPVLSGKTGVDVNAWRKLINGGIITRMNKLTTQPVYKWTGIKPNIYMANETLKPVPEYKSEEEPVTPINPLEKYIIEYSPVKQKLNASKQLTVEDNGVGYNPKWFIMAHSKTIDEAKGFVNYVELSGILKLQRINYHEMETKCFDYFERMRGKEAESKTIEAKKIDVADAEKLWLKDTPGIAVNLVEKRIKETTQMANISILYSELEGWITLNQDKAKDEIKRIVKNTDYVLLCENMSQTDCDRGIEYVIQNLIGKDGRPSLQRIRDELRVFVESFAQTGIMISHEEEESKLVQFETYEIIQELRRRGFRGSMARTEEYQL
jgi:hypothetical protein